MEKLPARVVTIALASVIGIASGCGSTGVPRSSGPDPERVEIGYGSQKKEHITGSVSSLTAEDIEDQRVGRVEELLADRVPGLTVSRRPDGSMAIRIRGQRSFMGSNEPLIVIDGMPVNAYSATQALTGLAPQSIERIDVLKDAGSTAVYGSRGANGVILITTKRARVR